MPGVRHLRGLTFATVGCAPHHPMVRVTYRVAAIPELRRDARVSTIAQQPSHFAVLDLMRRFHPEAEIPAQIVDTPAEVGVKQQPLLSS